MYAGNLTLQAYDIVTIGGHGSGRTWTASPAGAKIPRRCAPVRSGTDPPDQGQAWQDIQISPADLPFGDLPLHGTTQPHILANIEVTGHKINPFDIVSHLAPRDPASFAPDAWQAQYREPALDTPDAQPYPIP